MYKKIFLSFMVASLMSLNGAFNALASDDLQEPVLSNLEGTYNLFTSDFTITVDASDVDTGGSNIASIMYSANGGPWLPMLPKDGAFDSQSESAFATVLPLVPGVGLGFCVQATDSSGNISEIMCASANRPFLAVTGTASQSYGNKFFKMHIDLQTTPAGSYIGSGKVEVRTARAVVACNLRQFYSVSQVGNVTTLKSITNCTDGRVRNLIFTLTDNPTPMNDLINIVDVTAPEFDLSTQALNNGGITQF